MIFSCPLAQALTILFLPGEVDGLGLLQAIDSFDTFFFIEVLLVEIVINPCPDLGFLVGCFDHQ
jgi:hypothetical protein